MVQVLCVRCRVGTPAGEAGAPVPCGTCGTMLPPSGARVWWMSRGGAQFGPYTFAELVSYVAGGRILPDDNIWHEGAAVQTPVNQLPPLAGAAPGVAAAPVAQAAPHGGQPAAPAYMGPASAAAPAGPGTDIGGTIRLHVTRAFNWNLSTIPVQPDEEARLVANGVDDEDARRYLVWRRSVLLVVAFPMALTAALATIEWLGQDRSSFSGLGILIDVIRLAALFAVPVTAWFAAQQWDQHRRSRVILLRGWLFAFLVPLLIALVPISWRIDFSGSDPNLVSRMSGMLGLLGAITVFITVVPSVLSLIPGVMRACLRIKTLIPESILPGFFLVAATPLYVLLFLVIFTALNQLAGNLLLILAVLGLLGAPVLYLLNAGAFMQPLRTPEEVARIGKVQHTATIVFGIGLGLLVLYAISTRIGDKSLIGMSEATSLVRPWNLSVIQFPIEYFLRSLFTTALVADMIMLMNLSLWRHSQRFQATPEAQAYDRLMSEIEEAGGSKLMPTEIVPKT